MSGASDLQLFEQLVKNANSLFLSDEDYVVINGVTKPTLKKIYADFMASTGTYPTVAEGLSETTGSGTVNRFFTVPGTDGTYETRYRNDAGTAVQVGRISSADAIDTVLRLIKPMDDAAIYDLTDEVGFVWGDIRENGFNLPGLSSLQESTEGTRLYGDNGFLIMEDTPEKTSFGPLSVREVPLDGLWLLDAFGFVVSDLNNVWGNSAATSPLPKTVPYMAREVCGVEGVEISIYTDGLLEKRSDTDLMRITVAAEKNPVVHSSTDCVSFDPSTLGSTAKLYARPLRGDASSHTVLDLVVRSAPNPPAGAAPAPRILLIADSIGNHQGPMLLSQFLTGWGYAPTFVGTYPSSIAESDGWNRLGANAEARQSWSGNQFTYEDMTRLPLPVGSEAAYTSGTKAYKWDYNPFLRVATESDPVPFVKNGYIFDPAFYQQRFGLDTPTIVINALNTNDIRDQSAAEIYSTVYENDILIHSQIRAAWPSAKIIRCMPGTARNSGAGARNRDALWTSHYIPAIRAMLDARAALADSNISVASSWAFYSPEAGYVMDAGVVDSSTGAVTATLSDWLHPQGSARRQYYQYLAGHVACAAAGLI